VKGLLVLSNSQPLLILNELEYISRHKLKHSNSFFLLKIINYNMKTPKNFSLNEYLNSGSRSVMPLKDRELIKNDFNELTREEKESCLSILFAIQPVRERFGKPIFITCGYRSKRHELSRGRSGNSEHTRFAVDITSDDMEGLNAAFGAWNGGYKWYKSQNFIHVDLGRKRRW